MPSPGSSLPTWMSHPVVVFAFAALLTVVVHGLYIADADGGRGLLPVYPKSDSFLFLHRAWFEALVAGDGGYSRLFVPETPYLWLLTNAYRVFGPEAWVPFFLNAVLAGVAAGFIALTACRLFGFKAGYLAGVLFALCGPVVFFSGITVKTTLVLTLLAGANYFVVLHLFSRSSWALMLALALLTLAALDRNNAVVLIGLLAFIVLWRDLRDRGWARALRHGGLALTTVAAVSMAWATVDPGVGTRGSPLGINFYSGNAPGSRGGYTLLESEGVRDDSIGHYLDAPQVAETETGRSLTPWEVTRYWLNESWDYYREHPIEYAVLQLRKAGLLLARYGAGAPEEYRVWRWQRPVLRFAVVDFALVLAVGLWGVFLARRVLPSPYLAYLVGGAVLYAGTVWLFLVTDRLRMPLIVFLLPFAGLGLAWMLRQRPLRSWLFGLTVIAGGYFVSASLNGLNQPGPGWAADTRQRTEQEGEYSQRQADLYSLRHEAASAPTSRTWISLAKAYGRQGFEADVPVYAEHAIRAAPGSAAGYELLADYRLRQGDLPGLAALQNRLEKVSGDSAIDARRFESLKQRLSRAVEVYR